MNVIDSSAWVEYLVNGPNAQAFAVPIENVDQLIVPAIAIYEVFRWIYLHRSEREALDAISIMHRGQVVDLDLSLAATAAKLGADLKLPLADSIIFTTARGYGATLWTQDAHFAGLPGVQYLPKGMLPSSPGQGQ